MTTIFVLTKKDIETRQNGAHFEIVTSGGIIINFTDEAVKEFINDYNELTNGSQMDNVTA